MFANAQAGVRAGFLFALGLASVGSAGCFVESSDNAPPPVVVEPGRLTVRWTVDEVVNPNLCTLGGAAAIDIAVTTTGGASAGEYQAPCSAFATTISSLYPGNYVADALLIDSIGNPRTTSIAIHPFTIIDQSELVLDVDFPADSFLNSLVRDAVRRTADSGAEKAAAATDAETR